MDYKSRIGKLVALDPSDMCFSRVLFGAATFEHVNQNSTDSSIIANIANISVFPPYSNVRNDQDPRLGLSSGSAVNTKVLHTDGILAGTFIQYGNVDVYINGGGYQYGCLPDFSWILNSEACSC